MSRSASAKQLAIRLGLYPYARAVHRHLLDRTTLVRLQGDVRLYKTLLPAGALCFDVGANIGEKSEALLAAGARVVAFEPHPELWAELRARCGRNRDWTLIPCAVGSAPGIGRLHARIESQQSSLADDWEGDVLRTYDVPVITLELAARHFGTPFYCKLDVEGWELEALKGLSEGPPLLSFEFHLNPSSLAATLAGLTILRALGSYEVNVTGPEDSTFALREWLPLDRFMDWFAKTPARLPGPYGDIYARRVP